MFEHFDKAYCINLASREDRLQRVQKEFKEKGLSKFFERFPAVNFRKYDIASEYDGTIGPYHVVPNAGCLASHREIVKKANEEGLENVLVFEDDVQFTAELKGLTASVEDLKKQNWGLFYLGATIEEKMVAVTERLFQTSCAKATHAVAYNHTVYGDILRLVPEDPEELLKFISKHTAVDNFLIKEIQSKHNTFICNPMVAVQGRSFSDIVQMNIDYSHDQMRLFQENTPEAYFVENHR